MKQFNTPSVVDVAPEMNISDVLSERASSTPDRVLFGLPQEDGSWIDVTAAQFEDEVKTLAKGFIASGLAPGSRVALLAKSTYEWTLIDFALFYAGLVMVPVYETSSAEQIAWMCADAEVSELIVATNAHKERTGLASELPSLAQVNVLEEGYLDSLRKLAAQTSDDELAQRRALASGDDVATIIYTSGSTGKPKGCALTHSNFISLSRNARIALAPVVEAPGASTVLFITTAHVFARFISIMTVDAGVKTGHQPDTTKLLAALQTFKPSFLLAVPRVFEKVFNSAEQKAVSGGKGKIFAAATKTAITRSRMLQNGEKLPLALKAKFALFDLLVFPKLRAAMGGSIKYAVSGSAPLGERLGHFFNSLGIQILEGYGLTETTAPVSVNLPANSKIGTVGPPLPGVSVRVADDGEILVKGINVFQGYWNNPQLDEVSFIDGWYRTGDIGQMDDQGYITITGRKKEILVTAGGKNVSPAALEDPVRAHPIISQIVVVGDQRHFVSALITLDLEMLPAWLQSHGISGELSNADAANNPAVNAAIQVAIDQANAAVSRAESIRKFKVLPGQWTEESGHLTPKMSIKRDAVIKDFAAEIDEIYAE